MAETGYSPNLLSYLGLGLLQSAQSGPKQNLGSNLLNSLGQYGQAAGQYQQTQAQQADAEQRKKLLESQMIQQEQQKAAMGRIGGLLSQEPGQFGPEQPGAADGRMRQAQIEYGMNIDPRSLMAEGGLLSARPGMKSSDFLHGNAGDSFINPNTNQRIDIPADPNDPRTKPYYSPFATELGAMTFDHRTGKYSKPDFGDGKPLIRPQDSPTLQGNIAQSKQTGQELGTRAVAQPQAIFRTNTMIDNIDRLSTAMTDLDKHPGLSNITGTLMGRTLNITNTATSAQAKLDSIKSQLFVDTLQSMREASKTGGAVGNVSDREGDKLEATMAALAQAQDTPSFRRQLKIAQEQLDLSKARIRQAYVDTYGAEPSAKPPGAQPPSFQGLSNEAFMKARPR